MIRDRAVVLARSMMVVATTLALGACGGSAGPSLAVSSSVSPAATSTVPVTSTVPSPSTTAVRPVPTTGLYVPPAGATSPTVARATTTTMAWVGPPSTMPQLFDGLARSLASIDGVVHLAKVTTWEGSFTASSATEIWIDGTRQVARTTWTSGPEQHASVVREGVRYTWPAVMPLRPAMELPRCLGAPGIVTVVVDCPNGQLTQPYTIERGTVDGHDAITFVSRQIIEPREVDRRESFDAVTLLPLRVVEVGIPGQEPYRSTTTWTSDVVAPATLAEGYFTPEAIGVVFPTTAELMAAIPAGTPTYWLGESSGNPSGTLVVSGAEWSGMVAMLSYDRIDRRYAVPPALRVDTSPGEATGVVTNGVPACPGTSATPIGTATAVLRCPGEPSGRVIVEVAFADAVVRLESPYRCEGDMCTPGPLNDADTLLALARTLVRR